MNILPELPQDSCFKVYVLEDYITLSESLYDIYQVLRTKGQISILNKKISETSKLTSQDGEILTDYKTIVEGEILLRIEYIADVIDKSMAVTYITIPFITYIALPDDFKPGSSINVSGYIEHIYIEPVYKNTVYSSAILLLVADC